MSSKPKHTLAQIAFDAWHNSWPKGTIGRIKWDELSSDHQSAWKATAQAVVEANDSGLLKILAKLANSPTARIDARYWVKRLKK